METYGSTEKVQYGVTSEGQKDLLTIPSEYLLTCSLYISNLDSRREIARDFHRKFGRRQGLNCNNRRWKRPLN